MAKYYGMIQGNRGAATRMGSANSGFRVACQSYDGSVIVKVCEIDGEDKFRIGTNNGSACYSDWESNDFVGTFDEVKAMLNLMADIKSGKVSVVRHRPIKIKK